LLLALSDLAVEQAHDSDVELELPVSAIADKFLRYYWFHTSPFPTLKARPSSQIPWQNTGSNISLLRLIKAAQERGLSLPDAGRDPTWNRLRAKAATVVQQMPLFRLQTLRNNMNVTRWAYDTVAGQKHSMRGLGLIAFFGGNVQTDQRFAGAGNSCDGNNYRWSCG